MVHVIEVSAVVSAAVLLPISCSLAGGSWGKKRSSEGNRWEKSIMQDVLYVAITLAFFVVSIAYVEFCDQIK